MVKRLLIPILLLVQLTLTAFPALADPLPENIPFDSTLTIERDTNIVRKNLEKEKKTDLSEQEKNEATSWPKTIEMSDAFYRRRFLLPFVLMIGTGIAAMAVVGLAEYRRKTAAKPRPDEPV